MWARYNGPSIWHATAVRSLVWVMKPFGNPLVWVCDSGGKSLNVGMRQLWDLASSQALPFTE